MSVDSLSPGITRFIHNCYLQSLLDTNRRIYKENRPDLITRVFKLKLNTILDEILRKNIFGVVAGYTYVIEFQKRGLPYIHILIILEKTQKIRTPTDVDNVVSAELPDKSSQPRSFQNELNFNMHRPCDPGRCLSEGVCKRGFPKQFLDETRSLEDAFPMYKRRQLGTITVNNREITSAFVVPYNPYLTIKYATRINVIVSGSIACVTYLYPYFFKGCGQNRRKRVNSQVQRLMEAR